MAEPTTNSRSFDVTSGWSYQSRCVVPAASWIPSGRRLVSSKCSSGTFARRPDSEGHRDDAELLPRGRKIVDGLLGRRKGEAALLHPVEVAVA
jgi:hypothetical protein